MPSEEPPGQPTSEPQVQEAPIYALDRTSAIVQIESSEDLLQVYSLRLSGFSEEPNDNKEGKVTFVKTHNPTLNKTGINSILRTMTPSAHRHAYLSNHRDTRIFSILNSKSESWIDDWFINGQKYGVRDEELSMLEPILLDLMQLTEAGLRRSQDGNEQRLLFATQKSQEIHMRNDQKDKQEGLISKLQGMIFKHEE